MSCPVVLSKLVTFGCQGLTLRDENRAEALDMLNGIRSNVAQGTFQAQNPLPSAKNMAKLAWNCDLERLAQQAVDNCPPNPPPIRPANGRNYVLYGAGSSAIERQLPLRAALLQWSDISNVIWPANNVFDGNAALLPFANMIRARTLSVGCSSATCVGSSATACVFSAPSLVARGLGRNGEYANENAPPASRMDLMGYDCQAEQLALNHVRLCGRQPSSPSARPGYSENIHILETTATDLLGAIQNAIGTFTNELGGNGIPSNMLLTPDVLQRTQRAVARVSKETVRAHYFITMFSRTTTRLYSKASNSFRALLNNELDSIKADGTYKNERVITGPQGVLVQVKGRTEPVLNFCANNYLGLSSHPDVGVFGTLQNTLTTVGFFLFLIFVETSNQLI
ncbi:unnamed protein product [Angiostrongylus costaricensis]|uniref:SCP domain-containing protein n=1 Tax=Angiostrongylus costaricensis TaxID=334426 RepID=A0A0R3PSN8_ANGCS|nr:unnamed protein product [Angiostrongylus costaricensis]